MSIKCYVINLERARERRQNSINEFTRNGINFEFASGVDWKDISERDIVNNLDPTTLRRSGFSTEAIDRGALACWLSHRNAWQRAIDEHANLIAVFEDDAALTEHTHRVLSSIDTALNSEAFEFDIIFLYNGKPHKPYIPIHRLDNKFTVGLVKYDSIGAVSYVITRRAIEYLLDTYPYMIFSIDTLMHAYWLHNLRTYVVMPQVVFHGIKSIDHYSFNKEQQFLFSIQNTGAIPYINKIRKRLRKSTSTLIKKDIPKRIGFRKRMKSEDVLIDR